MGEHPEEAASFLDSVMEKVAEKLPGHDSSSSDSDDEKSKKPEPSSISSSVKRLFGREKPVHTLFGGGKCNMFTFRFYFFELIIHLQCITKSSSSVLESVEE